LLLTIWSGRFYWHLTCLLLFLQHRIRSEHPGKSSSWCQGTFSLTRLVNWQNLFPRKTSSETNSLETRGESCHNPDGVPEPDLTKLLKSRGFKEVIYTWLLYIQALASTSDRKQIHIFWPRPRNNYFCWLQPYLFSSPCS
jgi:hypothetical protein